MAAEENAKIWEPTPQQVKMAQLLANPDDTRTKEDKCADVEVAPSTLWRWEQKKEFRDYVNQLVADYTDSAVPHAWRSLITRMGNDTQAIKLFFELKNMYRDKKEISGAEGGAIVIALEGDLEKWAK